MRFKISLLFAVTFVIGLLINDMDRTSSASGFKKMTKVSVAVNAGDPVPAAEFAELQWHTIVNNSYVIPPGNATFSSYSQPSVNSGGLVVFRARSTGGRRETGIYMRKAVTGKVVQIADLRTLVPYPNNLNSEFLEFSAIARAAPNVDNVAFIGLHKPVYRFTPDGGEETRAGTAGIYVRLGTDLVITGASKLGIAPGFEYFAVPDYKNLPFDIFPGAPAITDDGIIVFKGNYNVDGVGKTGIFYRQLLNTPGGGTEPVAMIANTDTEIPGLPPSAAFKELSFGSTAPPSVAANRIVFLALDNEEDPHAGGIYTAPIKAGAPLTSLVRIGELPPKLDAEISGLTRIGEGLTFDGRYVGFWGAWGTETQTLRLYCPEDGNADIRNYCNGIDPLSVYDEVTMRWYQEKQIPTRQGIFLYDVLLDRTYLVSSNETVFTDYLFWVYSGKVPGSGSDIDAEPPRWRSSSFLAASDGTVVFKARTGNLGKNNEYFDFVDGLYMAEPLNNSPLVTIAETGMDGSLFDPSIPGTMAITGLSLERDGFRGRKLAVTATMANEEAGWGGIYMTTVGGPPTAKPLVRETVKVPAAKLGNIKQRN